MGPQLKWTLTASEAFVLGGVFLVYGLSMGLAAYSRGLAELQETAALRLVHDQVVHE